MALGVSKTREALLDLKVVDQATLVDVLQFDAARARAWLDSGAWATAVVTLELSADGIVWQAASPAVTFTANGNSRELDVRTWAMLRLRVSTADAAAGVVNVVTLLKTADVPTAVAAHAASHLPDGIDAIAWAATIHGSGTLAARPAAAAANAGCLYFATDDDGGTLYRSNGSAWTQVAKGVTATATPVAHAATHAPGGPDALLTAPAGASAPGDSASEGSAAFLARSDHVHAREPFGSGNAPGTITLATERFLLHYRRLKLAGSERMTLAGTALVRIADLGDVPDVVLGSPKAPSVSFRVPSEYFLDQLQRLTLCGAQRATLQGTANLVLTDDFNARSRIVLAGRG